MRQLVQLCLDLFADSTTDVQKTPQFVHPRANREALLYGSRAKRAQHMAGPCCVAYELRRSKRKTIGFSVGAEGLVVSAPRWAPLYAVDQAVQDKAVWILSKLRETQEREQRRVDQEISWADGAAFPYLSQSVSIVLDPKQSGGRRSSGPAPSELRVASDTGPSTAPLRLHISLPHGTDAQRIRGSVQAWLMRQARRVFEERLAFFAPQLGVRWTKLSLSSASSRWGSASSDGAIRLNWHLIHLDQHLIDYVVVHELSHLRVMDHSPRFWQTVGSVLPDYAQRKAQLRLECVPTW